MTREDAEDGLAGGRYGVIGNPVAHSLSPQIHAAFARQTGLAMEYSRVAAPVDRFRESVDAFFAGGGHGLNVTVPFKVEAHDACGSRSPRARQAGAVNWLVVEDGMLVGDNTDGIGLVRDLDRLMRGSVHTLDGARVLLLGAGGAARGVIGPLLAGGPRALVVANRDRSRAVALAAEISSSRLVGCGFDEVGNEPFEVIVNATAASLAGESVPIAPDLFARAAIVYDMMYGARPTAFLADAHRAGATALADGLGMLVEQAAESFFLWRGVLPQTAPVLEAVRASLAPAADR